MSSIGKKMPPGPSYCGVQGCLNNSKVKPHLAYFSVPRDVERRRTWTRLIMREDLLYSEKKCKYYVCSDHFDETMLKNKRLQTYAVPTLRLPGTSASEPAEPVPSCSNAAPDREPAQANDNPVFIKVEQEEPEATSQQSFSAENPQISQSNLSRPPPAKRTRRDPTVYISQSLNNIEDQVKTMMQQKDYYDEFGLYIASLLRVLSKEKAEALKPKILNMINSASNFRVVGLRKKIWSRRRRHILLT